MHLSEWTVSIEPHIVRAGLWPQSLASVSHQLEAKNFMPKLTVASDVLHDIRRRTKLKTLDTGYLQAFHQMEVDFTVEDVHWLVPPRADDLIIPLQPKRLLTSADLVQARDSALSSCVSSRTPEATDFFRFMGVYCAEGEALRLQIAVTYPLCTFELRKLEKRLKVVSCPLAQELCAKNQEHFRSGFLTMDQSHRLLPVQAGSREAQAYPLVGIWVAGATV